MKLSIIIPVYNGEDTIKNTLDSLLTQQYTDFEIVIVNDGSTDSTLTIINSFILDHPNISCKVITKSNAGLPLARKTGIENAVGEYVGFVDADDWVDPNMYLKLIEACENEDADIACCNIVYDYSKSSRVMKQKLVSGKAVSANEAMHALNCRMGVYSSYCNKIIRKKLFQGLRYPKYNMSNEDYVVMIQLIPKANRVVPICYDGYHYVQRHDSMIRSGYGMTDERGYYCIKRIMRDIYKNGSDEQKIEFDTYMVDFFLFLIVDMGKNKKYDHEKIKWIRQFFYNRIIKIVTSPYHTLLCKASVVSVCVNYRFFTFVYNRYLNCIDGK